MCCRQIHFGGTHTRQERLEGKSVTSRFFFLNYMKCNHRCSSQVIVLVPLNCGVMGCVVTGVRPGKKLTRNVKQGPHHA